MGKALSMVADELKIPPMTPRALPPVLVLISDGQPTDDFDSGLQNLMDQNWGKKLFVFQLPSVVMQIMMFSKNLLESPN